MAKKNPGVTLISDGNEFQQESEQRIVIHWKCSEWSSYKSIVMAISTRKQLLSKNNEHYHEFFSGKVKTKHTLGGMMETARMEYNSAKNIIVTNSLIPIGCDVARQLSLLGVSAINWTLNHQKGCKNDRPEISTNYRQKLRSASHVWRFLPL